MQPQASTYPSLGGFLTTNGGLARKEAVLGRGRHAAPGLFSYQSVQSPFVPLGAFSAQDHISVTVGTFPETSKPPFSQFVRTFSRQVNVVALC